MASVDPVAFLGTNPTHGLELPACPIFGSFFDRTALPNVNCAEGTILRICGSASNYSPDYFLCVRTPAIIATLSGSPQWECLRVSER
jgi:hypothetical protein